MKPFHQYILAAFAIAFILCGCSRSLPASQAAQHIGEKCTVEGYVASVGSTSHGTVFLNFDKPYPNQSFTAVSLHGALPLTQLTPFQGKSVRVTGTVESYKGKPQIILHSLRQISLAG